MSSFLTEAQQKQYAEFQNFAATRVAPFAREWDEAQAIAPAAVAEFGRTGYLGATIPKEFGGQGWDTVTFGLLNEALGRHDSAFTGLLTVQSMISMPLVKWGSPEQRARWLPALAKGEIIGAIALTEPAGGSDLQEMSTEYRRDGAAGDLILNGEKRWITSSQIAGLFIIFGKLEGKSIACLVPRDTPGFEIEPIRHMLGFRAAGLGRLRFHDVKVPAANVVGKPGFAFSHIAPIGLHYGRISTAFSSVGLLRACFEESTAYAATRKISGHPIGDFGMIQSLIAKMGTDLEAARLLCWNACRAADDRSADAYTKAFMAKYFASKAAVQASSDAVLIHGASGCNEAAPVARYYRGSKIMEIIEGTTHVHETVLGKGFVRDATARLRNAAR